MCWEARRVEVRKMLSKSEISSTELQNVAERIKLLRQKATEHAVEIGRELLRVKASLPHGVFVNWVERSCEFKIRTAQDLMKLARAAGTNAQLVALMVPSTLRVYLSKQLRRKSEARFSGASRRASECRAPICTPRPPPREPKRRS